MTFRPLATLAVGLFVACLATGCEEYKPKRTVKSRDTVGKTTQVVRNIKGEVEKGAKVTDGKNHETDYLGAIAGAYRTAVPQIAALRVKSDIALYEAANDTKIKTYEEFMDNIIKKGKPDGIMLPMLPFYQEYGYDPDTQELVVLEYPELKKKYDEETDKAVGRK